LAGTDAKNVILRHAYIDSIPLELVQRNTQELNTKDAVYLLKMVLSKREEDTPEWGKQLVSIIKETYNNGLIELLQAIILCFFLY